jgi:hypothetical protein
MKISPMMNQTPISRTMTTRMPTRWGRRRRRRRRRRYCCRPR